MTTATAEATKTDEFEVGDLSEEERAMIAGLSDPDAAEATEGEAEVEGDKPAADAVADEPQGKKGVKKPGGDKDAAIRAERGKAKAANKRADEAEDRWAAVEAEKNRLAGQIAARRPGHLLPDVVLTEADLARIRKAAEDAGNDTETFGALAGTVSDILAREIGGRMSNMSKAVKDGLFEIRMEMLDHLARGRHDDYEAMLAASEITKGLVILNGRATDEVLARKVFGSGDPAEELYLIAVDKLKAEGRYEDVRKRAGFETEAEAASEEVEDVLDPEPAPQRAAPAARRAEPAKSSARTIAEAREEGRAEVVREIAKNGQRPRGIGAVPSAGKPATGWGVTRRQLDSLAEQNPDGYRKLMGERPGLREWYLSGGD